MNNPECILEVFIVTYNRAQYLKHSIQSVLAQTYSNFELTILDNCSTDNTQEVCGSFSDPRLKYVRRDANLGGLGNINDALNRSKKKYFLIFHDDDVMLPHCLEYELEYMEKNPQICAFTGGWLSIPDREMPACGSIRKYGTDDFRKASVQTYHGAELFHDYLNHYGSFNFPTIMYRTEFIRQNKLQLIGQAGPSADILLILEMLRLGGTVAASDLPLQIYRIHADQDSQISRVSMVEKLFTYFRQDPYYSALLDGDLRGQQRRFRRYALIELCLFASGKTEIDELQKALDAYGHVFQRDAFSIALSSVLLWACTVFPGGVKLAYRCGKRIKDRVKRKRI